MTLKQCATKLKPRIYKFGSHLLILAKLSKVEKKETSKTVGSLIKKYRMTNMNLSISSLC